MTRDPKTMDEVSNKIRKCFKHLNESQSTSLRIPLEDGYSFLWTEEKRFYLMNEEKNFVRPFLQAPIDLRIRFIGYLEDFLKKAEEENEDEVVFKRAQRILEKRHGILED